MGPRGPRVGEHPRRSPALPSGLWVLQAVAGDCSPGGHHGSELPWGPLGTAWFVGACGGEPTETVVVVPGRLSLSHSLKGSSLGLLGARCLLTAPLTAGSSRLLSPSQRGVSSGGDGESSSCRVFLLAAPHQSLWKELEMRKSAEMLLRCPCCI